LKKNIIAKKYAKSIYDACNGKVDNFLDALGIIDIASQQKEYNSLVQNPLVNIESKVDFLTKITKTKDDKVKNFIKVIAKNHKISVLPIIFKYIKELSLKDSGKYTGFVISKDKVSQKDIDSMATILSKKISKDITLEYKEKSDFDGIKVDVDSLGIEVIFSKESISNKLLAHIVKAI